MQECNNFDIEVLNLDGKTVLCDSVHRPKSQATLSYPRATRISQIIEDVEHQRTVFRCKRGERVTFYSNKGTVLRPHQRLNTVLHAPSGYCIVAKFEASDPQDKKNRGKQIQVSKSQFGRTDFNRGQCSSKTKHTMKQGNFGKPTPRDPIRGCNGQGDQGSRLVGGASVSTAQNGQLVNGSLMGQGKTGWGSYKIPKNDHGYNKQPGNRSATRNNLDSDKKTNLSTIDSTDSAIRKRGLDTIDTASMAGEPPKFKKSRCASGNGSGIHKKEAKTVKLTAATNSALGDLIKNYSTEDDDDDEGEEGKKDEIHDVYGGVWQVMEPPKTNKSSSEGVINATTPWRTKPSAKEKAKEKAKTKNTNDKTDVGSSSVNFSAGIGTFLNALKSESKKPKPSYPTVTPYVRSAGSILKTPGGASSKPSNDWSSVTKTMRTYAKLTNHKLPPPIQLSISKTDEVDGDKSKNASRLSGKEQDEESQTKETSKKSARTSSRQIQKLPRQSISAADDKVQVVQKSLSQSLESLDGEPQSRPVPVKSVSSRTRRAKTKDDVVDDKEGGEADEEEDDNIWEQQDIVLLSIKCKGPISNKQIGSCINGIFLDLQEQDASVLEALTADEVQSKLECIYQRDLSDKKTLIDYVFQKLKREGPKKQKDSSPVVATVGKIGLTRTDLYTLADSAWLNDNIINSYFHLLPEMKTCKKKVFAFTTFFYTSLTHKTKGGYDSVKRWTDHVDLFAQDLVLIPVHQNRNHWTLAAVQVQQHRIEFYNSLGSNNSKCIGVLIQYLRKEATVRKRHLFTSLNWGSGLMKGLTQQTNGSDCGVYICQYAKRLCQGRPVKFTTMEAMGFRQSMVKEIIKAECT